MIDGEMQDYELTLDKILTHAAKWHPHGKIVSALDDGSCVYTSYDALHGRARRMSAFLSSLGIVKGDRVATLAWNSQGHVESWFGIMSMGAICHTLNPRLTETQLASMVRQSGARVILASSDLAALAQSIANEAADMRSIVLLDCGTLPTQLPSGPAEILLANLYEFEDNVEWGNFDERTPCGLCFTSGTTGAPKGVTYTHRSNFLHTMRQLQADTLALRSTDSILVAVPMFHANAWGLPFSGAAVGSNLILPGRHLDGASLVQLIRQENITVGVGVPTVWLGVVEHLDASGGDLPSLERIAVGGAPMPPALMDRVERRLGVRVQTTWGMTELSPLGTASSPYADIRPPEISGRPALGLDLLLSDADGQVLEQQRGSEGHLKVRGLAVVQRYFGQCEDAVNADGWFDTGDLARIEENGDLVITGRSKDLIKSGGEWINPAEIEALVSNLPQVSLAAVVGRTDDKWGERPILCVELSDVSVSDSELLNSISPHVAPWWVPDAVIRLESMPLAATGKIDKTQLRREHGDV